MKHLSFGSEKDKIRMVVENGVDASDTRVMTRTNEAIQLLLGMQHPETGEPLIPVNAMTFAAVDVVDGYFDLPPNMEAAYHVEQSNLDGSVTPINGSTDVTQGFYNIINPFTYFDPSMSYDNPFIDYFLVPSPTDSTQVVRRYYYSGFTTGRIFIIGPKSYLPITSDDDFLIVQNVPAIKTMIQSREYTENGRIDEGEKLYDQARKIIIAEIKKHQMDPRYTMARKANYEADLVNFAPGSKAWVRARIALEVPGAMNVGKNEIGRLLDRAQLRMMEAGTFKGCIEEFNALITDGFVYLPARAEAIIAANLCGSRLDVRSIFYKYLESGPGEMDCACAGGMLEDAGEVFFPHSNQRRRKYRAHVGSDGAELSMVCKLRWEEKQPGDQLTITNLEANRIMVRAMLLEQADKWNEAEAALQTVLGDGRNGRPLGILHKELKEYLRGVQQVVNFAQAGMGMSDLGGVM